MKTEKMKKVEVIGGSGFVGCNTANELSNKGYLVKIIDQNPPQQIRDDQELVIEENITFSDKSRWKDRYMITPYRYTPKKVMKLTSEKFIDLGQGILDLVEEIHHDMEKR
jgi:hypothetical protein